MVEKKLNFNQPILSVRRYSPKIDSQVVDEKKGLPIMHLPPPHTPESNSGPVSNPGSVPFLWEQIPGQPKEEILAQTLTKMEAMQKTSLSSEDCNEAPAVDGLNLLCETDDDLGVGADVSKLKGQKQEQTGKVVNQDKPILLHCRPSFEKSYLCYQEEQGSDDSGDHRENVITVCCLLPRSFFKSLLCVNPVSVMRATNRVITFPSSTSSTDSENKCAVNTIDKIEIYNLNEENEHGPFPEEFPRKKSYKTLQELLLADEDGTKEKTVYVDTIKKVETDDNDDDSESDKKTTSDENETNINSDSDQDTSSEDDIRVAVNNARKKQLSRATTLGSVADPPPPPPLPESPSGSWLSRTLSSSASAKKVSSSVFISRFSNNYRKTRGV